MKLIKKNFNNNTNTVKFLGIPIITEFFDGIKYKKKYLFGLLKITFNVNHYHFFYKFLGFKFMNKTFHLGKTVYTLFNTIKIKRTSKKTEKILLPLLIKYFTNIIKEDSFELISIYSRSGESYLFLSHWNEFIQKYNIKNPIIITNKKNEYLKSLLKAFNINVRLFIIPDIFFEIHFANVKSYNMNNYRYIATLTHKYFTQLETRLRNNEEIMFYERLRQEFSFEDKVTNNISFSQDIQDTVLQKISSLGLKKPFIYVTPEAQSNETLSDTFWNNLCISAHKLGYDVFFNTLPADINPSYYKHCYLNLYEAMYLSSFSNAIIGIRSGLMDLISNNKSEIFCIFMPFKNRSKELHYLNANLVSRAFTLSQLPAINPSKLHEYNAEKFSEEVILHDILEQLEKSKNKLCNIKGK